MNSAMNKPLLFYRCLAKDVFDKKILRKTISYKNLSSHIGNRKMLSPLETHTLIANAIQQNRPFFVGRLGGYELSAMIQYLEHRLTLNAPVTKHLIHNAGLFNIRQTTLEQFARLYFQSCGELDIIGRHWNGMENYVISAYAPKAKITDMFFIEPYFPNVESVWTKSLQGKNVLVIHPFENSIQRQYQKRTLLFENPDILPEFHLITLKAVQTIGNNSDNRFSDWFEALDYMYQKAMQYDFDVALVGCGAYGFPLSAKLKQQGKTVIHLGGALQILFGIKGKRWETLPDFDYVRNLFNDNWIYPSKEETVSGADSIENGCYW